METNFVKSLRILHHGNSLQQNFQEDSHPTNKSYIKISFLLSMVTVALILVRDGNISCVNVDKVTGFSHMIVNVLREQHVIEADLVLLQAP